MLWGQSNQDMQEGIINFAINCANAMMFPNIHFSVLVPIGKQLHEFNFRKRSADLYDADTSDERGNRLYFKMVRQDNAWTMQGLNLPFWITCNETLINEALLKNNENNTG